MNIVRSGLPKKRSYKLTERLHNTLVGKLSPRWWSDATTFRFRVWKAHSRWVWWKFYE